MIAKRRASKSSWTDPGDAPPLTRKWFAGADLHDGPAQLVAYASLRLGSETVSGWFADSPERQAEIVDIRARLDEAIDEIRGICNGLVLPHIERTDLAGLIELAARAHEQRTGSRVRLPIPSILMRPSASGCTPVAALTSMNFTCPANTSLKAGAAPR